MFIYIETIILCHNKAAKKLKLFTYFLHELGTAHLSRWVYNSKFKYRKYDPCLLLRRVIYSTHILKKIILNLLDYWNFTRQYTSIHPYSVFSFCSKKKKYFTSFFTPILCTARVLLSSQKAPDLQETLH